MAVAVSYRLKSRHRRRCYLSRSWGNKVQPDFRPPRAARQMRTGSAVNEKTKLLKNRTNKNRTKRFALDVLAFVRAPPRTDEARSIAGQLIRSGTGVAANYRAACRSRSQAEFVARISVALEEADESALWFEILTEGNIWRGEEALRLLDESVQLSAICARSRLTAAANLRSGDHPTRSSNKRPVGAHPWRQSAI